MHRRLTIILLVAGIVASLGVANAYFTRGAYNDGFATEGPSPRDRTILVAQSRQAAAQAAAVRTFKGGRQSLRDWSDMLGRYAPWMSDFEISAVNDAAGKQGVDVASVVRQNSRSHQGKRYVPSDVSGLGGDSRQGSTGSGGRWGQPASLGSYPSQSGRRSAQAPMPAPTYSPASDTDVSSVPYETVLAENAFGQERAQEIAELSDPRTRYLDTPTTGNNETEIPYVKPGTDTTTNPEVPDDSPVPNPEPGTLALGAMGLAALASRMRRLRGKG